jgi:hypothetical protein
MSRRAFTSNATGITDRGPYGYYEVNNRGTIGKTSGNIYSLYVQDEWAMRRLTLNLGLRTEKEIIPSFRPDIRDYAIKFGFGDKLAPRIGASYDWFGDGHLKVYGSWGRYFDWPKYELSRDRTAATSGTSSTARSTPPTSAASTRTTCPAAILAQPRGYRDLRAAANTDPNTADVPGQHERRRRVPVEPDPLLSVNYVHNKLTRTIEDFSVLVDGDNVYSLATRARRSLTLSVGARSMPDFAMPKPLRRATPEVSGRRFELACQQLHAERLYGNYLGLADSTRSRLQSPASRIDDGNRAATSTVSAATRTRGGTLTRCCGISRQSRRRRSAPDRPHVVKLYGVPSASARSWRLLSRRRYRFRQMRSTNSRTGARQWPWRHGLDPVPDRTDLVRTSSG